MNIAWIGTAAFHHHLVKAGHAVGFIRLKEHRLLTWETVCREAGMTPDVVVYSDRSFPPPILDIETFPCLTCCYVVDSHIHSWLPVYAAAFDCRAVSLLDHMDRFDPGDGTTIWLPPYPRDRDRPVPDAEKKWDVLFVGNVDPETTPKRAVFLEELEALLPGRVHVTKGVYRDIFPHGRIILNIAERGDLNFRVFEALACGACLLTPAIGHGQDQLFEPGCCFETYRNLDSRDAAAKIEALLADPARRDRLARAGLDTIREAHRMRHRSQALETLLVGDPARRALERRLADPGPVQRDLRLLYLHWAEVSDDPAIRAGYMAAAQRASGK